MSTLVVAENSDSDRWDKEWAGNTDGNCWVGGVDMAAAAAGNSAVGVAWPRVVGLCKVSLESNSASSADATRLLSL